MIPLHHHPLTLALALVPLLAAGAAQGPTYGCPLTTPAPVAGAGRLGGGGWVGGGGFHDRRAVGIDTRRNRAQVAHGALDLVARRGVAVLAVREGRVVASGGLPHLGTTIVVAHRDGSLAVYALLGTSGVTEGTELRRGAVIGTAGFSGDGAPLLRRPAVLPRLHLALLDPRHANAGATLWGALARAPDAWVAALDSLASPRDPRTLLPATCFTP